MGKLFLATFLLELVLAIVALISCLSAEDRQVRALPRIVWVLVILLFPLLGSIAYLATGRPVATTPGRTGWRPGGGAAEPGRPTRPLAPDDDPDFLHKIDKAGRSAEEDLFRRWEEDLRRRDFRREDELRKRDNTTEDTPPDS